MVSVLNSVRVLVFSLQFKCGVLLREQSEASVRKSSSWLCVAQIAHLSHVSSNILTMLASAKPVQTHSVAFFDVDAYMFDYLPARCSRCFMDHDNLLGICLYNSLAGPGEEHHELAESVARACSFETKLQLQLFVGQKGPYFALFRPGLVVESFDVENLATHQLWRSAQKVRIWYADGLAVQVVCTFQPVHRPWRFSEHKPHSSKVQLEVLKSLLATMKERELRGSLVAGNLGAGLGVVSRCLEGHMAPVRFSWHHEQALMVEGKTILACGLEGVYFYIASWKKPEDALATKQTAPDRSLTQFVTFVTGSSCCRKRHCGSRKQDVAPP
jgi:hypothetical protein